MTKPTDPRVTIACTLCAWRAPVPLSLIPALGRCPCCGEPLCEGLKPARPAVDDGCVDLTENR